MSDPFAAREIDSAAADLAWVQYRWGQLARIDAVTALGRAGVLIRDAALVLDAPLLPSNSGLVSAA